MRSFLKKGLVCNRCSLLLVSLLFFWLAFTQGVISTGDGRQDRGLSLGSVCLAAEGQGQVDQAGQVGEGETGQNGQAFVSRTYLNGTDIVGIKPMAENEQIYEFLLNERVVLRYRSMAQGFSAQERAQIIFQRAEKLGPALREGEVAVARINGSFVITIDGQLFITVTEADFQANNSTAEGLANVWLKNLLGAREQKQTQQSGEEQQQQEQLEQQPRQGQDEWSAPNTSGGGSGRNGQEKEKKQGNLNDDPAEQPQSERPSEPSTGVPGGTPEVPTTGMSGEPSDGKPTGPVVDQGGKKSEGKETEPGLPGGSIATAEEVEMLGLINAERAKTGVAPLIMDLRLVEIARLKSQDMIAQKYFEHQSPTYGDPFTMMSNMGIKYGYAGENLAGSPSLAIAHESLMGSAGHRKNILNPQYTHVGIGIVPGGPYGKMYTQLFISKL